MNIKPHSMWMFKDNPICLIGDTVRLREESFWMGPHGTKVYLPAGTLGQVKAYRSEWGEGIAFDFGVFSHPEFGVFPNALDVPGNSRYSDSFELVSRKAAPHETVHGQRSANPGTRPLRQEAREVITPHGR